ncbi:CaiB/BaiF CoA-transferase family protein [Sphingomonas sp. HITSZ_GF]|uniref:CaiB/BaiF CoA transferase family protein n=1 Tax=Sphingomonas sp. HITSZ_GF TaxID=3037247 RepID=UPI00240D2330|nr:CaiB/BaiF CoA-transferase family protein [Sphingomonas sp. HITSZ_GF]MDG2533759.1 CaiB/BaiF CoA-transferase family protein [Sphingomonas sp. HITSZ_GF]
MVATTHGPLAGLRIVEFDSPGTVTFAGMLLADLGCDVVRILRPRQEGAGVAASLYRGRSQVALDLAQAAGREQALALIAQADGVIEGYRPGVAEQVGLDPARCLALNPRLVYARTSGWGREGPLAGTPGNDINHLALSGALHAIGPAPAPVPPLNLIGEYAGGALYLALGLVSAILAAQATGRGQVIEAAQLDGAASMMTLYYALHGAGRWADARAANMIDGGAPYYRCYACADGRHVAVGALEPQAFRALCGGLGLPADRFDPYDRACWPALGEALAAGFATRGRDEWAALFESGEACVTPVLSLTEAPLHPHNRARATFDAPGGVMQPMPAPRFSTTPAMAVPATEESVADVLERWA